MFILTLLALVVYEMIMNPPPSPPARPPGKVHVVAQADSKINVAE